MYICTCIYIEIHLLFILLFRANLSRGNCHMGNCLFLFFHNKVAEHQRDEKEKKGKERERSGQHIYVYYLYVEVSLRECFSIDVLYTSSRILSRKNPHSKRIPTYICMYIYICIYTYRYFFSLCFALSSTKLRGNQTLRKTEVGEEKGKRERREKGVDNIYMYITYM